MHKTSIGWFTLVLGGVFALACDHHSGLRTTADAGKGAPSSDVGAATGGDAVAKSFSGVIIATLAQGSASNGYGVFADFATGPHIDLNPAAASCSCIHFISALPLPSPDAGTVSVWPPMGGSPLATLTPADGAYHGSWDLGFLLAGNYASVTSQAWNPGDELAIDATGGGVQAFSGRLQVPALFSGVTPDLLSGSLVIDRTRDFTVTWAPEGKAKESVLLILQQIAPPVQTATTCYCTTSDSAAALTVDASTLGQFGTEAAGTLRLERLVASAASCDNATITLVGEVAESAAVAFQ